MGYDEMTREELEAAQEVLIIHLNDVKDMIEHLEKALNDIADVDYDGADGLYDYLYQALDDSKTMLNNIKIDLDDIENQMAIIDDMYDEFAERNSEYWASQF